MDLHPTFGRQELFETLSQGSARSSSRGGLSNSEKSNSRSRQQIQQQNSIQDEAAIRLLGHKLSLQAHEGPNPASMSTTPAEFGWSPHLSCFTPYRETNFSLPAQSIADPTKSASTTTAAVPVRKVAKMQLHDHGNHHHQHHQQQHDDYCPSPDESDGDSDNHHHSKSDRMSVDTQQQHQQQQHQQQQHSSDGCWSQDEQDNYMEQQSQPGQSIMSLDFALEGDGSNRTSLQLTNPCSSFVLQQRNITKRLTAQCRECYDAIAKAQSIVSSMSVLSQRQQQQLQEQHSRFSWKNSSHNNHYQHHPPRRNLLNNKKKIGTKGILASVMETSATISSGGRSEKEDCSTSRATQSISTKDCATTTTTWNGTHHSKDQSLPSSPPPPDHAFYAATMPRGACLTEPSVGTANDGEDNDEGNLICYENDLISVPRKTLRMLLPNNNNKRSSARCAADFRILRRTGQGTFAQVFEVLHLQTNDILALKIIKNKPAYTRQAAIEIDIYQTLRQAPQKQQSSSSSTSDYMVHLHAYFMHKNHLCLVFELLSCNLYEVLKRRQFRGLSVSLVQDMMRQAVAGIRELANQNIVHCDLKPENILLTTDDGTKRVVESGTNNNRHGNNSSKTTSSTTSSDNTQSSAMVLDNVSGLQYSMNQNGGSSASSSSHQGLTNSTTHASNGASSSSTSTRLMANNINSNTDESIIKIKLIDFGSACFEGLTAHTYIQSRFYRSPEVLLGLPYDSSIDMWSLGCLAAELFLGLPILPGMHEHDQMRRITEMISPIPDWMIEQGSKATKCYVKYFPRNSPSPHQPYHGSSSSSPTSSSLQPKWRLKTQHEYVIALSQSEVRKRGGLEKLNKPINNRYFKREKLSDIVNLHAQHSRGIDRNLVRSFIHFLYGLLDPDPWKRLTAFQASQHPFITGELELLLPSTARPTDIPIKEMNQSNLLLDSYWQPPWDPSVCRRKLLHVQKLREKQNSHRLARSSSRASMVPPFEDQLGDQQSIVSPQSSEVPAQVSSSCSNTSPYSALFHFGGPNRHQNDFGQQQSQTTTCSHDVTFQNVHPDYIVDGYSSFASSSQGFGQAIERPGVIPGNSVSTCNSQSIGYSSAQSGSLQSTPQVLNTMFQNQVQASWQSNSGTGLPNGGNLSVAGDSVRQQHHHQFLDHVSVRSTASSISDATMITDAQYQGFLAQQQQQQFLLAQHQQFLLAQQQQQQFGAFPTGIPFQQMPMRFDQQQIPPQTTMPGGGTYFYMVNPAIGQPMLLQAVDFPNPPLNNHPFIVSQEHLGVPMGNQGPQFMNPRQAQLVHGGSDRHEMSSARSARRRTSRGGMSM